MRAIHQDRNIKVSQRGSLHKRPKYTTTRVYSTAVSFGLRPELNHSRLGMTSLFTTDPPTPPLLHGGQTRGQHFDCGLDKTTNKQKFQPFYGFTFTECNYFRKVNQSCEADNFLTLSSLPSLQQTKDRKWISKHGNVSPLLPLLLCLFFVFTFNLY